MNSVSMCGVGIDIADGPIGISFSGGADSSLLLYILMSHHPGPLHAFTLASDRKRRSNVPVSMAVMEWCMQRTGFRDVVHHTYFTDQQDIPTLLSLQNRYRDLGLYHVRYVGVTANPPADAMARFTDSVDTDDERDPLRTRPTWIDDHTHLPFTNCDKSKIAEIYHDLGLMQDLFPMTRSCESIDITQGHCGTCWWCEERRWGFGRLS